MSGVRKTKRERLAEMLSKALGFDVNADELHGQKGYWRQNINDCYRIECFIYFHGEKTFDGRKMKDHVQIVSWSTMTDIVKSGGVFAEWEYMPGGCGSFSIEIFPITEAPKRKPT